MKLNLFIISVWGALCFLTFSFCGGDSSRKVDDKAEDITVKQNDLDKAERDFEKDWEEFRNNINDELKENENSIATYRGMEKKDKTYSDKFKDRIDNMEAENKRLRERINSYNTEDKTHDNWVEFKREFRHDMDELGHAIKDLGKDNK
jgi:septal ring factor EnvC (AmiA/AmiB activator)